VIPVDDGVLCVRRAIPPGVGSLAFPGGFVDVGESWQQAAAREAFEEAGVVIDPRSVKTMAVLSAPERPVILIFGVAAPMRSSDLSPFMPTSETSERVIVKSAVDLAFPLHTHVLKAYFAGDRFLA
jgi:ADP-ribose pyrophosphatase YjhB (NUDIX family)